jgi:hypothetical protein
VRTCEKSRNRFRILYADCKLANDKQKLDSAIQSMILILENSMKLFFRFSASFTKSN